MQAINQAQENLNTEVEALLEYVSDDFFAPGYLGDLWDDDVSRRYCLLRWKVIEVLFEESKMRLKCNPARKLNELALHIAFEHMRDLITADQSDNQDVRYYVPSVMIGLGKYEKAYDFLKFWFIEGDNESNDDDDDDYDEDDNSFDGCLSRSEAFSFSNQNFAEPVESMRWPSHINAQQFLDMALVKLCIFSEIRAAQILSQSFVVSDDVLAMVTNMTNVPRNWRQIDTGALLSQARQFLTRLKEKNKHILTGMIDPTERAQLLSMHNTGNGPPGSVQEASFVLQRSFHLWKKNRVALNFVSNFTKIKGSGLSYDWRKALQLGLSED